MARKSVFESESMRVIDDFTIEYYFEHDGENRFNTIDRKPRLLVGSATVLDLVEGLEWEVPGEYSDVDKPSFALKRRLITARTKLDDSIIHIFDGKGQVWDQIREFVSRRPPCWRKV